MADRNRLYRGLPITASAVYGVVCVLLCVLWVRSYWWLTNIQKETSTRMLQFASKEGGINLFSRRGFLSRDKNWRIENTHSSDPKFEKWRFAGPTFELTLHKDNIQEAIVRFPYWFPVLLFAALAAVPWIRWRLSLRTLLIAVTLVAVGLGVVVYLVRQ